MRAGSPTQIGVLRASGLPQDSAAARLALSASLGRADLHVAHLPPSAVLIVRHLALPAVKVQAVGQGGGRVDPTWERAASERLASIYRRAVRPVLGAPPEQCDAVWFADEAELLAALALDLSLGGAEGHWWWQAFRRRWGGLAPNLLPTVLVEWPQALPAALRLLHEQDRVEPVLRALSSHQARQVMDALWRAFDVAPPDLSGASPAPSEPSPARKADGAAAIQPDSQPAPWRAWLAADAVEPALALECICLLGVALALAHAPIAAQAPSFRAAVVRWWQQEHATRQPAAAAAPRAARQDHKQPAAEAPRPRERFDLPGAPPDAPRLVVAGPPGDMQRQFSIDPPAAQPAPVAAPPALHWPAGPNAPQPAPNISTQETRPGDQWPAAGQAQLAHDAAPHVEVHVTAPELAGGVATELAGVLFLVNVMRQLDIPACFEAEWRLASQIGSWGTLELLGRALLAEAARLPTFGKVGNLAGLSADPLWAALSTLDGRGPGVLPGAQFAGAGDVLNVPPAWLNWLTRDPSQSIDLASLAPLAGPLLAGVSHAMQRWLAAVAPLLRQMLQRALAHDADPAAGLLLRRGQLYVTSSHVDLVMPLDSVSLAVRRAGLDFDPGWLPDFGRVVQFHYER